jgi:O-antigen/teichoic acid export membrane protein
MKQSQRIVKNVLAGGLAVGVGGLLQLGALVFIARSVGVAQFGTYSFILAFAMFFQLLADSGLSNILVRELATKPDRVREILGAALSLTWLLTAAAAVLIVATVPFLHLPFHVKALAALMGAATLAQFHATVFGAALRAHEDNEWHALGFFLHKVLFCLCVVIALKAGLALLGVVLAHLIPNLFQWSFYRHITARRYGPPKLRRDVAEWKFLLTHSIPIGGATMIRLLAQQIDVMILTWLTDLRTVGLFSGPYRLSQALRFIPQTMAVPLYPLYSRLAAQPDARPQLQAAYERSVKRAAPHHAFARRKIPRSRARDATPRRRVSALFHPQSISIFAHRAARPAFPFVDHAAVARAARRAEFRAHSAAQIHRPERRFSRR